MRDITILFRTEAIYYCEGQHSRPSIIISISDPYPKLHFNTGYEPHCAILRIMALTVDIYYGIY